MISFITISVIWWKFQKWSDWQSLAPKELISGDYLKILKLLLNFFQITAILMKEITGYTVPVLPSYVACCSRLLDHPIREITWFKKLADDVRFPNCARPALRSVETIEYRKKLSIITPFSVSCECLSEKTILATNVIQNQYIFWV